MGRLGLEIRNHDVFGRGMFNKTIFYVKGKTYTDWHCNMNSANKKVWCWVFFLKEITQVKVFYKLGNSSK